MYKPALMIVAVALVAGAALLIPRCTGHDAETPGPPASNAGSSQDGTSSDVTGMTRGNGADAASIAATESAMREAVWTLHQYLTALGTGDPAKYASFWAGGEPSASSDEADLRTLEGLQSLRIENGTPTALDSLAVPQALEIPVTLRAAIKQQPQRRYTGKYRLRKRVGEAGWEITSASVDVSPTRQ